MQLITLPHRALPNTVHNDHKTGVWDKGYCDNSDKFLTQGSEARGNLDSQWPRQDNGGQERQFLFLSEAEDGLWFLPHHPTSIL